MCTIDLFLVYRITPMLWMDGVSAFKKTVGQSHANICTFNIVNDNVTIHYKIVQDVGEVPADPQKQTYRQVNIQVSTNRNRNIMNYLRAFYHTIT